MRALGLFLGVVGTLALGATRPLVRTTPAAVGYVSAGRDLGSGVRVLSLSN